MSRPARHPPPASMAIGVASRRASATNGDGAHEEGNVEGANRQALVGRPHLDQSGLDGVPAAALPDRPAADLPSRDRRGCWATLRSRNRPPAALPRRREQIVHAALAADPGRVMQYISWDKDEPGIGYGVHQQRARRQARRCNRTGIRWRDGKAARQGRHRPHADHAEASHRHVRGSARKTVPRCDGTLVRSRDRLRRGAVLAVHPPPALRARSAAAPRAA